MSSKLGISNVFARVITTPKMLKVVRDAISFTRMEYVPSKWSPNPWHKVTIRLVDNRGKFLAGLTDKVVDVLRTVGEEVTIVDMRTPPVTSLNDLDLVTPPREYQVKAIDEAINAQRGVLWLPANAGKTLIMAGIIQRLGMPVLVLTHKQELLRQTADSIGRELRQPIGKIGAGYHHSEKVTVATVQSLYYNRKLTPWLHHVGCLLVDECHHTPSKTFVDVCSRCRASYRFGLSGTPLDREDADTLTLIGVCGPVISRMTNLELVESGVSVKPLVRFIPVDCRPVVSVGEDFTRLYRRAIVCNHVRNSLIAHVARKAVEHGLTTLVLVREIEHGKRLSELLGCQFIHGTMPQFAREEAIEALRHKDLHLLISTEILDEGVDVPGLDCVVIAAGGQAQGRLLQRIGRAMRQNERGYSFVIDFMDRFQSILLRHSRQRFKTCMNDKAFDVRLESVAKLEEGLENLSKS